MVVPLKGESSRVVEKIAYRDFEACADDATEHPLFGAAVRKRQRVFFRRRFCFSILTEVKTQVAVVSMHQKLTGNAIATVPQDDAFAFVVDLDCRGGSRAVEYDRGRCQALPHASLSVRNLLPGFSRPPSYPRLQAPQPSPGLLALSSFRMKETAGTTETAGTESLFSGEKSLPRCLETPDYQVILYSRSKAPVT